MPLLPLQVRSDFKRFVVIGGGVVATRNVARLINAGAHIEVRTLKASQRIHEWAEQNKLTLILRNLDANEHFDERSAVILATDDSDLNAALCAQAKAHNCWTFRVDESTDNDFLVPEVVDRSPIKISVSSQGTAPGLTQYLKQRLDAFVPKEYQQLANFVAQLREQVAQFDSQTRLLFWRRWFDSQAPELVLGKNPERAQLVTQELLDNPNGNPVGEVYLVGAGPGEPDLLTFRALRLIQAADVVFYDRLVGEGIMTLINPEAEQHYVGKAKSNHAVPQEKINQRLVDEALLGKKVLRLKGGDPFIFGRGGEEIQQIAEQGIPFQVVPGITAASGCAAFAGIPLTHRDHAQSVRFVTGHLKNGTCDLPWHELAHPQQTLVIYMGLSGLPLICRELINHGMDKDTPVGLIEKGTRPDQRVHITSLAQGQDYIQGRDIAPPTLIIVGDVVHLHRTLNWR